MAKTSKRIISFVLACIFMLSASAPALAYSEVVIGGSTYSSASNAIAVIKERLAQHPEALSIQSVFSFLAGFNRSVVAFLDAQLMSEAEIDSAAQSVLNTVFFYIGFDEYVQKDVICGTVPIEENDNYIKLFNVKVLRKVCAELYERQFEFVSTDRPDLEVTPYNHYVGELALHVIAYSILKSMGGYDSIFPDYFFSVSTAELNVSEPRFKKTIVILGKVLA